MANKNEVLKLGIDAVQGRVSGNYSKAELGEGFVQGLIEMNGGSTKLDPRTFHRGTELFALVEELLPYISNEGLKGDEFFMNMVDYRNMAEGDMNEFVAQDKSLLLVGNIARGSQAVRRQRLGDGESITIPTQMHAIKVYEELRRLMAGRVDFATLISRLGESFTAKKRNDIYAALTGVTAATKGLNSTYVQTGSYDEDDLLELIEHVEAANNKAATIIGTKAALRKITTATVSHEAESDMYNAGFYGKFNGTPMVSMKQAHQPGTDTFVLPDNKIWIIAGDDKPIKFVTEGEGLLIARDSLENADLTQELERCA